MRMPSSLMLVALLVAACGTDPAAPEPNGVLTGSWHTAPVPSGAATVLTLEHAAAVVIGHGRDFGVGGLIVDDAVVTGSYADSTVELRLRYQLAGSGRFTGRLVGPDMLQGTWAQPAPVKPSPVTFYRQPIR
jgi:hypothetical protein